MKNFNKYIFLSVILVAATSCNDDEVLDEWLDDNPEPQVVEVTGDAGDLDLTNYVALGNSLTAGFTDGALYPLGQANSFPSILAGQFAIAGGGSFNFPNISSGNGYGGGEAGSEVGKAFIDVAAALTNPANAIQFTAGSALTANTETSLNNFGVPGARIVDATNDLYGLGNPFFGNFNSVPGSASMLDDAAAAGPTFFSVWLGNNDVLGYATSGGLDEAMITSQGDFQNALITILGTLSAGGGTEGVILNIPPVHLAPYFQIVTTLSGGVNLLPAGSIDAATAAFLNSGDAYGSYNAGLDALVGAPVTPTEFSPDGTFTQAEADYRKITFTGDVANAPVIMDEFLSDLTGYNASLVSMRQAKVNATTGQYDLFPLTALAAVGVDAGSGVQGVAVPLADQYTLTMSEQVQVITAYATYNATISGVLASFPNVKLVDVGPMFADVFGLSPAQAAGLQLSAAAQAAADGELGIMIGGFNQVPLDLGDNLFNSIWSADGIHPNQRGAAIIANEIIKVLNAEFSADIPMVDVIDYASINAVLP